eukprot:02937.XXX_64301_62511_1 [CDS] Oithona nana genome sequencing.
MVTSNGTKEVCELSLFYDPLKQSIKDGLRINCHGSLPVNKVLQDPHEGFYQCHAKLKIASAAEEIKQNQKIFLKVEANSALPTILAIVLVTILGTFLVIGAGLKLSGHQMTWQQKSVEPEVHFSRDYRFSESYPSPRNARHHSITSNMSGIVFNATPASMANLMKKLETVDDEGGSSASNQSQPATKHTSRAEEDETEASIIVEKLENEPKVSPKTNSNAFAFEDDTSNIKAAAAKKISRHLAFMKFITEITEKRRKRNQETKKQRSRGGSVRVRHPSNKTKTSQISSRRSSLGVLPNIGIGSGVILEYPKRHQQPMTSNKHHVIHVHHRLRQPLTSENSLLRRHSMSSTMTNQTSEMPIKEEEPSVILEMSSSKV